MNINRITKFLYENSGDFGDSKAAIRKALMYAAKEIPGLGGYVFIVEDKGDIIGTIVVNRTGMNEYLSENIMIYVTVKEDYRGKGHGKRLIDHAISYCKGDIAIHIKFDNPAIKFFESYGFKPRNIEMRLER